MTLGFFKTNKNEDICYFGQNGLQRRNAHHRAVWRATNGRPFKDCLLINTVGAGPCPACQLVATVTCMMNSHRNGPIPIDLPPNAPLRTFLVERDKLYPAVRHFASSRTYQNRPVNHHRSVSLFASAVFLNGLADHGGAFLRNGQIGFVQLRQRRAHGTAVHALV